MGSKNQKIESENTTLNVVQTEEDQEITFWGTRGTLPSPGEHTVKYGGQTSCVEVTNYSEKGARSIIFDGGTGIVKYGKKALKDGKKEFHICLTHMHYDHLIGLTQFMPLYEKECTVHFYGQAKCGKSLKEIFSAFFAAPFFPIEFHHLSAQLIFHEINGLETIEINGIKLDVTPLNHPQDALAFRLWSPSGRSSIVYATDHEHGTELDERLLKFIKGTQLFIYDATYSDANYLACKGWGHSTSSFGARLAKNAPVDTYVLFHHDIDVSDRYLEDVVLAEAKKVFPQSILAQEGKTLKVSEL